MLGFGGSQPFEKARYEKRLRKFVCAYALPLFVLVVNFQKGLNGNETPHASPVSAFLFCLVKYLFHRVHRFRTLDSWPKMGLNYTAQSCQFSIHCCLS